MYQEMIRNLESIQGTLLRTNHSFQAEGTFGIMKMTGGTKELCEEASDPFCWKYILFQLVKIFINSTTKE